MYMIIASVSIPLKIYINVPIPPVCEPKKKRRKTNKNNNFNNGYDGQRVEY